MRRRQGFLGRNTAPSRERTMPCFDEPARGRRLVHVGEPGPHPYGHQRRGHGAIQAHDDGSPPARGRGSKPRAEGLCVPRPLTKRYARHQAEHLDFKFYRHPELLSKSHPGAEKKANKNSIMKLYTKTPEVNRSGEYRPGENKFRMCRHGRSGEPPATTFENNEKFQSMERAENGLCREVGGATGTAV